MSADAKVQTYEALNLGYLPIQSLTIRHTIPPTIRSGQSLSLELRKGERIVSLTFIGLKELSLADLGPSSSCLLRISSVEQDQREGIRYRVSNQEQDLTLAFYCADFEVSA